MLEIENDIKCRGSILSIGLGTKNIFVLDSAYHLNVLSSTKLTPLKTFLLEKKAKPLHQFSKAMSAGSAKELLYGVNESEKVVHLTLSKVLERSEITKWHNGDANSVKFSPSSRMYVTGGADGRSHLFKTDGNAWLNSYEPRPDYISNIAFSSDESKILISSFDGMVTIYDIERNTKLFEFKCDSVAEDALFFDNSNKVCAVTRNRGLYIFDMSISEAIEEDEDVVEEEKDEEVTSKTSKEEVKKDVVENEKEVEESKENDEEEENRSDDRLVRVKNAFDEWPTTIIIGEQNRFALVGSKKNKLYLVYLKTAQILKTIVLENQGISEMKLSEDSLYIGFVDGTLFRINRNTLLDEFKSSLDKKDFKEAQKLFDTNELLCLNIASIAFEEAWPSILAEAMQLIEDDKLEEADEKVKPFITSNKLYSDEYLSHFEKHKDIKNFIDYVNVKNYAEAYAAAEMNPEIEKLHAYQKLEEHWQIVFKNAKKLLSSGLYEESLKAEKIMQPFMKVPNKKKLSQHLIANGAVFEKAELLIKEKKFRAYFSLIEQFPFLKDVSLYQKVIHYADSMHEKVVEFEHNKEFDRAIQLLEALIIFPPYKELAKQGIMKIKTYADFAKKVNNKEYVQAYAMAEKSQYLKVGAEFVELKDAFKATYVNAEKQAELGNPDQVLDILDIYMKIEYWKDKVKNVMQKAYISEMEFKAESNTVKWPETFEKYANIFGKDMQLQQLAEVVNMISAYNNLEDTEVDENIDSSRYEKTLIEYMEI